MYVTARDLNQLNEPDDKVPVQRKFDICLAFDSKIATCNECVSPLELICRYVCCCNEFPTRKSKQGALLKQACVDANMALSEDTKKANLTISPYYNMNTNPPSQIFKSGGSTTPVSNIFEALNRIKTEMLKSADNLAEVYKKGSLKIPDFVLSKDPTKPAEAPNIDKVFEVKFPGDTWGEGQKAAYEKIAGTPLKVIKIIPDAETDTSALPGSTEYNEYDHRAIDDKIEMIEKDRESFENVHDCECEEKKKRRKKAAERAAESLATESSREWKQLFSDLLSNAFPPLGQGTSPGGSASIPRIPPIPIAP